MSKHTPGPWRYQRENEITPRDGGVRRQARWTVYSVRGGFVIVGTCDKEMDARLFAAAPEMLEALKAVQIAATTPGLLDGEGNDMTVDAAMALVDSAIAKAEGE